MLAFSYSWKTLRADLTAGLTTAVVALPLAIAFGVASGLGPEAGLYGAIAAGFFSAIVGGCPTLVTGPTGPMTVVLLAVLTPYSDKPGIGFLIVVLAGLIQMLLAAGRAGNLLRFVPHEVVSGFMSGIGLIIVLLQIGPLLGHASPGRPLLALLTLPSWLADPFTPAIVLGLVTLAAIYFFPKRVTDWIPGPLLGVIVGTGVAIGFGLHVETVGAIPRGLPTPHFPWPEAMTGLRLAEVLLSASILGLMGALDSLITSLIADEMTDSHQQPNRVLAGQGLGNLMAGLFGGVPCAGTTSCTVVNITSGARTRLAAASHALILLVILIGFGPIVSRIPNAVLAAVLLQVGLSIMDWKTLLRLREMPRHKSGTKVIVILLTVCVDLLTAVFVGIFLFHSYLFGRNRGWWRRLRKSHQS
ncbi:MAG: SulP family inorganic anion transporter [Sumerlaeia bacterium]